MCGIAGIVTAKGAASVDEIGRMTSLVEYRGPDDFGYLGYSIRGKDRRFSKDLRELAPGDGRAYDLLLGHRRLAILDLSEQGRCPMPSADGRLWITYNGEIYNYIELRAELSALGHRFATGTDTEVILAAYREWGTECLKHFNGMWSFALLDADKSILFCARDRLGEKPFYYHWDGTTFSFGSEIKQLLCLPRVSRDVHAGVLFDFLVFSTYGSNAEETFYRDVRDMRGGHYLLVPLDGLSGWTPKPVRYWSIDLRTKLEGWTDQQYAERYRELFEDAVRIRLRSDVPVGSCLSGGLDSSGIVCVVDRLLKEQGVEGLQKTFTSLSDNPLFDERDYAQAVIDATRVRPSYVTPSGKRLLKDLDRLLWHQDEPFVSTSIFAGWCVYALAREQGVKVTLDGQGPDEMLGGYVPTLYPSLLLDSLVHRDLKAAWANIQGLNRQKGIGYLEIGAAIAREAASGLLPARLMPSMRTARSMLSPDFIAQGRAGSIVLRRLDRLPDWRRQFGGTPFDQRLLQATMHEPLPGILRQVDRNSMAFSVEARLPFLDPRLVEYTFSLPVRQKIENGLSKQVYRRAMAGVIPELIRGRTSKLGFVTAEADWLRDDARDDFEDVFSRIPASVPYRRDYAADLFNRFSAGVIPYDSLLWKIFSLEKLRQAGTLATANGRVADRRFRVCLISPGVVHAVSRAVAISPYLDELHFIDMLGTADRKTLEDHGIYYHTLREAGEARFSSVALRRLLTRIRPDVITCHYGLGDHFFNAIALNQCPVSVVAMGTDVLHDAGVARLSALQRLLARMGLRRADSISAKSHFLADELVRMGVRSPIDVNYWGCDLGQFTPGPQAPARARLGLPEGVKIVLSPRAVQPIYNIELIVDAFPAVLRRWPDAILLIVGRPDPAYEAQLAGTITRLGLGASVRLAGSLPADALPDYYRASDVVVSVASSEGFPNTVLEVMACGVPVLAGDIPQLRELLSDGVNAKICPVSVAGIETALCEILGNPEGAARIGAAGRSTVLKYGDIDANGKRRAAKLRALATAPRRQGWLTMLPYRLVLRLYQLTRILGFHRSRVSRGMNR